MAGIGESYTVYYGGNLDIHPTVTWTHGELENYTYSWKVDGILVSDKAELTEQVKDLPLKSGMYSEFVIKDDLERISDQIAQRGGIHHSIQGNGGFCIRKRLDVAGGSGGNLYVVIGPER